MNYVDVRGKLFEMKQNNVIYIYIFKYNIFK